jgi:histidine triad (HIT) family protein
MPTYDPQNIFAKILRGELPCHKVYEDELVLAFLDIAPLARGHTLVIPKEEAVTLAELSDESAAAIGRVLPRICRAVVKATGTRAYNVLENNGREAHQVVMHVHFHVIPKPDPQSGLGIGWPAEPVDRADAAKLAEAIAALV